MLDFTWSRDQIIFFKAREFSKRLKRINAEKLCATQPTPYHKFMSHKQQNVISYKHFHFSLESQYIVFVFKEMYFKQNPSQLLDFSLKDQVGKSEGLIFNCISLNDAPPQKTKMPLFSSFSLFSCFVLFSNEISSYLNVKPLCVWRCLF